MTLLITGSLSKGTADGRYGGQYKGAVADEAEMLEVGADQIGDTVTRTDEGGRKYELVALPASDVGNWRGWVAADSGATSPADVDEKIAAERTATITPALVHQSPLTLIIESDNNVIGLEGDISNGEFDSQSTLKGLSLGSSVTTIGSSAFNYCSGFTGSLTIPDSVTTIGSYAFSYCSGFTNVDCYVTRTVMNATSCLLNTSVTTLHARASDGTWTAGADTIGGKALTVIKDL